MKEDHFLQDGFSIERDILDPEELSFLSKAFPEVAGGRRVFRKEGPLGSLPITEKLNAIVDHYAISPARPVRMIYFDKTSDANWSLGWHQDRTIAVAEELQLEGYDIWSRKSSVPHVEPPFDILEQSITLRISLDVSDETNGALEVIPGSHHLGRLSDQQTKAIASKTMPVRLDTKAGDVVVLSTPILHRSKSSKSPERRRTIHIDYSWAKLPAPLEWAFEK